jgi:quercetin dioxygenase-like cupin family protein
VEVTINGKTTTAEKGDVLFFSTEDWHNVHNVGSVPAMYYVLNWSAPLKAPPTAAGAASAPAGK